jgi:cytochrome c553
MWMMGLLLSFGPTDRVLEVEVKPLEVDGDADRGEFLARSVLACDTCHGADLSGGVPVDGFPMGRLVAPNLTPAGVGSAYGEEDWVRAVRHGVALDGRPLVFMWAAEWQHLTQEDLADLVAFLEALPPVESELPKQKLGPVGKKLVKDGVWLQVDAVDHQADIPRRTDVERGQYLAEVAGCHGCHGADWTGLNLGPGKPRAANLTPHTDGLEGWTEDDFQAVMKSGKRPDGTLVDEAMPWQATTAMWSDEDLNAVWAYLRTLESKPTPE